MTRQRQSRGKTATLQEGEVSTPRVLAERESGRSRAQTLAELALSPSMRHANLSGALASAAFTGEQTSILHSLAKVGEIVREVKRGQMNTTTEILAAQVLSLDCMFTEFSRRAMMNLGEYPEAVERYMRLALKAQANARVTVEALVKMLRGGEQVIKHVHIDNRGGQTVVAETVQTGGINGKANGQPHGTDTVIPGASLPRPDPLENVVPIPGDAERAVPVARGEVTGRTVAQSKRLEARRPIHGDDDDGSYDAGAGTNGAGGM